MNISLSSATSSRLRAFLFPALAFAASLLHAQTAAPDLSLLRTSSATVYEKQLTVVTLTVTNRGTAAAPSVNFNYTPAQPALSPLTPGYTVASVVKGHSGRDGGYTKVGSYCTQSPAIPLAPGATVTVQFQVTYPLGTFNETWTVDAGSGVTQLNQVTHTAGAVVTAVVPPIPSAPVISSVLQSGASLLVNWTAPAVGGSAVTSSLVTAVPGNPNFSTLSATAPGAITSATLAGLSSNTTYSLTVQCTDAAGTGPASAPFLFTTKLSKVVPGTPTGVTTRWSGTLLVVSWTAPTPGDSAIDDNQVILQSIEGGALHPYDAGTATTAYIPIPDPTANDWNVVVRAHNAAGWGPHSIPVIAYGL